jgi:hypothetical protein
MREQETINTQSSRRGFEAGLFVVYAMVIAFMTWPAVTLVSRTYAQRGDPYGVIWWSWWFKFAFTRHLAANPMSWVAVPYGRNMSPFARDPLTTNSLRALSIVTTETIAYNVFILLAFFSAAVAMYFFARRLTRSRPAAAVAGFIFAFSPYMLMQGKEHISMLAVAGIPLVFYFLIRAWKEHSALMGVLCAVSFVVMTLFNYHYGLIGGTLVVAFLVSVWLLSRPWKKSSGGLMFRVVPLVLCLVGFIGLVTFVLARRHAVSGDLTGLYLYSARVWDYFLPTAQGAAFGWATYGFITSHIHGGFLVESSLFLGFVPLGLAVFGLVSEFRGKPVPDEAGQSVEGESAKPVEPIAKRDDSRIPVAFAISAGVCFLCSLPPTGNLFGLKVYFPGYLLHYIVPDVRAYARFGIGVTFCVAILAAYGIAALLKRGAPSRHKLLIAVAVSLLVLVEFAIVPPFRALDTTSTTEYYRWLKGRPGDPVVAMYPFFYADDFANYNYYFDQRHHEKKMVNGSAPDTEAEEIRRSALDLTNPATPGILKKLGTKYVLAVPSMYREGNHVNYIEPAVFQAGNIPKTLKRVKRFADCYVYEDVAEPATVIPLFTAGAYQPVVYPDGHAWHPGSSDMLVNIRSERKKAYLADVSFKASATSKQGTLEFELNGSRSGTRVLPVWPVSFTVKSVSIDPGDNLLTIKSKSALSPVTEIPGATEVNVGIMVSDITISPL